MQVLVIQNDAHSPISLLGDYLQAAGAKLTTLLPHSGDKLPASPDGFDGAVILGGPQHAHDDARFPAFLPMLDLLRAFHAQTKPLLGMCLGGQLMAKKVTEDIARLRGIPAGIDLRSPSRHPDVLGADDLVIKVEEFREATGWSVFYIGVAVLFGVWSRWRTEVSSARSSSPATWSRRACRSTTCSCL